MWRLGRSGAAGLDTVAGMGLLSGKRLFGPQAVSSQVSIKAKEAWIYKGCFCMLGLLTPCDVVKGIPRSVLYSWVFLLLR